MYILPFDIPLSAKKIDLKDPIFSIGSCFADNIGEMLSLNKFEVEHNPFGVIYNPYSIFQLLQMSIDNKFDESLIFQYQEAWRHWSMHSKISEVDKNKFSSDVIELIAKSHSFLKNCKWVIITLGTAHVYELKKNGFKVANCHKVPQNQFVKQLMSVEEILTLYGGIFEDLKKLNPSISVIFTVSPVRHIRDGLIENNLSKSILLQAVHKLCNTYDFASYFPSYELIIDVLRDYRFYKEDMIHPSDQAIKIVWDEFITCFMNEHTKKFIDEWSVILTSLAHKPINPNTPNHQKFKSRLIEKISEYKGIVNVDNELNRAQLD